jgi:hypothetical protein
MRAVDHVLYAGVVMVYLAGIWAWVIRIRHEWLDVPLTEELARSYMHLLGPCFFAGMALVCGAAYIRVWNLSHEDPSKRCQDD